MVPFLPSTGLATLAPTAKIAAFGGLIMPLKKSIPKIVLGVQPEPALCAAAKDLNIDVYDIQHGVVAISDWPYAKEIAQNFFSDAPKGILLWDTNSLKTASRWARANNIELIEVGNPWFERFKVKNKNDKLINGQKASFSFTANKEKNILISLQPKLKDLHYSDIEFDGILFEELKQIIAMRTDVNWLIRLHPDHFRNKEVDIMFNYFEQTFANSSHVNWLEATSAPLPLLLSEVDLHITDSSSVVIECAWFKIPSALLNQNICEGGKFSDYFIYERASGIATLIPRNVNSINSWINIHLTDKKSGPKFLSTKNRFERWLTANLG